MTGSFRGGERICRFLPPEWIYDQKMGFPMPFRSWLTGPFACWLPMLAEVLRRLRPERTRS